MKVLIIAGHPRKDSFSNVLAEAYKEGAEAAGVHVRQLVLADLVFNPNVVTTAPQRQEREEDVITAQEWILWADHLVFVYPTWWGTMPALLKAFLDRVFTPGFAFAEAEGGNGWVQLLKGKTGQLITTMDTPLWVYRWILGSPGHKAMSDATLQFCGVSPVRVLAFSAVKDSSIDQRKKWLQAARATGLKLADGVLTPGEKFWRKVMPWLKALRLQFYPMTFAAYTAGAFGAATLGTNFNSYLFWIGYLWLFLLEVATVFSNDYFDYSTDKQNKFFGPFNGGSRVLVDGDLTPTDLKKGASLAFILSLVAAAFLLSSLPNQMGECLIYMAMFCILALGYTAPPLKLSYRGLGELDVAFTHSFAVILGGFVFQGGSIQDPFPWLLGLPTFLSILPSIALSGIPDLDADKATSKNTLAVRLGRKGVSIFAVITTILSAISLIYWKETDVVEGAFGNAIYGAILHSVLLLSMLYKYIKNPAPPARIDKLMIASLTYLIWFILIPLVRFW